MLQSFMMQVFCAIQHIVLLKFLNGQIKLNLSEPFRVKSSVVVSIMYC